MSDFCVGVLVNQWAMSCGMPGESRASTITIPETPKCHLRWGSWGSCGIPGDSYACCRRERKLSDMSKATRRVLLKAAATQFPGQTCA